MRWSHLAIENKPAISKRKHGLLELELKQVPNGWPYEYQWSGITRHVRVDIAKFPVLQASVPRLVGYAHLDIEVLDSSGKAVKGVRSTTITSPGTIVANLGDSLDPAIYRLRLRLIVRGPNSGCKAVYDWIRFVRY